MFDWIFPYIYGQRPKWPLCELNFLRLSFFWVASPSFLASWSLITIIGVLWAISEYKCIVWHIKIRKWRHYWSLINFNSSAFNKQHTNLTLTNFHLYNNLLVRVLNIVVGKGSYVDARCPNSRLDVCLLACTVFTSNNLQLRLKTFQRLIRH